jgi:predicted transcriptional regulator
MVSRPDCPLTALGRRISGTRGVISLPLLDAAETTMYVYIMQRTQIYLTEEETTALDREAARTGRTRSQLIRDAIEEKFLAARPDAGAMLKVLRETAGAWKDRESTGEEYVEAIRPGMGQRLASLWPERFGPDAPPDR